MVVAKRDEVDGLGYGLGPLGGRFDRHRSHSRTAAEIRLWLTK